MHVYGNVPHPMKTPSFFETARNTLCSGVNARLQSARLPEDISVIADWITHEATRLIGADAGFASEMLPSRTDLLSEIETGKEFSDGERIILRSRLFSLVNARVMDAEHTNGLSLVRAISEIDLTHEHHVTDKNVPVKKTVRQ